MTTTTMGQETGKPSSSSSSSDASNGTAMSESTTTRTTTSTTTKTTTTTTATTTATTTTTTTPDDLLNRCLRLRRGGEDTQSSDEDDLETAWWDLATSITNERSSSSTLSSSSLSLSSSDSIILRERIARRLLTEWPRSNSNSPTISIRDDDSNNNNSSSSGSDDDKERNHPPRTTTTTTHGFDRALDACGFVVTVSTCSSLLKEIAAVATAATADPKMTTSLSSSSLTSGLLVPTLGTVQEEPAPVSSSARTAAAAGVLLCTNTNPLPLRTVVKSCWSTLQRLLLVSSTVKVISIQENAYVTPLHDDSSQERTRPNANVSNITESSLWITISELSPVDWTRFVNGTVLLLPQILANACHSVHVKVPLHATPSHFYRRLVQCTTQTFLHRADYDVASSSKVGTGKPAGDRSTFLPAYTFALLQCLLQSGRGEFVAQGVVDGAVSRNNNDKKNNNNNNSNNKTLLRNLSLVLVESKFPWTPRDAATLILTFLQYLSVKTAATTTTTSAVTTNKPKSDTIQLHPVVETCQRLFESSSLEHQEAIVEHLVFSRSSANAASLLKPRQWANWIVQIMTTKTILQTETSTVSVRSSLAHHLTNIAERWSMWQFVQDVDGKQQHHVSLVIWLGLKALSESLSEESDLTIALVQGVSHRLETSLVVPRQDGMRIAEEMAKGLGQEVHFDELDPDPEDQQESEDGSTAAEKSETTKAVSDIGHPKTDTGKEKLPDDDDDDDDDRSVEWEDELVPYDLRDDEEDLMETQKPLTLVEALDLLRTAESHDHASSRHEVALNTLPELIRARPDNLPDVAASLALQVLRMENKFNLPKFGDMRDATLQALLVQEPVLVGQALIESLFEEGGLGDRLVILSVLQSAAKELSGGDIVAEDAQMSSSRTIQDNSNKDIKQMIRGDGIDSALDLERVLSKTRRKRSKRVPAKVITNHFAPIAPIWFYALMAGFFKHAGKDNETLWEGSTGSLFLAHFLRCMAALVEFSGPQASQVLACDLLDLVWKFRTADVSEVRLSVLLAVGTSLAVLPDEQVLAIFLQDDMELPKLMAEMKDQDPDESCRELSQLISQNVNAVLNGGSLGN